MQSNGRADDSVEDTLEEAIFRAGGILESNRGKLSKARGGKRAVVVLRICMAHMHGVSIQVEGTL
jgi:hypothetical protein